MKVKKDVLVFRTLPFIADSRVKRYLSLFPESDNVTFKTWEKEQTVIKNVKPYPFLKRGSLIKKIFNFIGFQFFCLFSFLKLKKGDVAICMDLDTALFPVLFKFLNPGVILIFDIVDPFSQTKGLKYKKLHKIIDYIEYYLALRADLCIVPHTCRVLYYKESLNKDSFKELEILVIENIPDNYSDIDSTISNNDSLTIGYFGTLDSNTRGLEELLSFAKNNPNIKLIFAGGGSLERMILEDSINFSNIEFLGGYNYSELFTLYSRVDFTWAFYSPEVKLHKYACPNKFFEHILYTTPIIISAITPQSAFVNESKTGLVIDNIQDIYKENFKKGLTEFKVNKKGIHAKLLSLRQSYKKYYAHKSEELKQTLIALKK